MNILEFARRAKVSTATISRAFHEPEKLKVDTRDHILALATQLGYYPSPSGRALKRGRHDVLGVIWPLEVEGAEAEFALRILASLTRHLVANDLDLLVCPIDRREPSTLAHAHRILQRSRCDAWILLYPRHHDILIRSLKNSHKPVVCLMGGLPECPSWKCVRLNQRSWIEDALHRLKAAGCRRVSLFGSRAGEPDHEERQLVFADLAPKYFRNRVSSFPGWPPEMEKIKEHIASHAIDGIIGVDDRAALTALDICREMRLSVPAKMKVVGIDDVSQAHYSSPSLSSYRQPLDEMAGCAVELALGTRQRSRLFEAVFVPRQSLPAC
ncbi:MAG: LacI family DNA-binding transcriptional regulator [Terrimicrobiaceae bacterium]